jgi:hypothetical protein
MRVVAMYYRWDGCVVYQLLSNGNCQYRFSSSHQWRPFPKNVWSNSPKPFTEDKDKTGKERFMEGPLSLNQAALWK